MNSPPSRPVGIPRTAALGKVRSLLERHERNSPLLVVVAHGARGSGRTAFVGQAEDMLGANVPSASLSLRDDSERGVPECLARIGQELSRHHRLRVWTLFPRLLVGLTAWRLRAELERSGESVDVAAELKDELRKLRRPSTLVSVLKEILAEASINLNAPPVGGATLAVPTQSLGALVDHLAVRRYVDWYLRQDMHEEQGGLAELVALVDRVSDDGDDGFDALLCAAFRADLCRPPRRVRRSRPAVVLLDDIDHGAGPRLLAGLTSARGDEEEPAAFPLLVVGTSRKPLPSSDCDGAEVTNVELGSFDQRACRQLLSWYADESDPGQTVQEVPRRVNREAVALIHAFSAGHPGTVAFLARAYARQRERAVSVGGLLEQDGLESELMERLLEWSDFRRDGDLPHKALAICAIARDTEGAEALGRERECLQEVAGVAARMLEPPMAERPAWTVPLRLLLARRLSRDTSSNSWTAWHTDLGEHCRTSGGRDGSLYHLLAAGRLDEVAGALRTGLVGPDRLAIGEWLELLEEVTRAPHTWQDSAESPCDRYERLEREFPCDTDDRPYVRLVAALWILSDPLNGPDRVQVRRMAAGRFDELVRTVPHDSVSLQKKADEYRDGGSDGRSGYDRTEARPRVQPPVPPRPPVGRWVAGALTLVLVGCALVVVEVFCGNPAYGIREMEDECVGVTDGSFLFHPGLESVTNLIRAENDRVQEDYEADGLPYLKVALMTTLTPTENSPLDVARVRAAMEGAHVAQWRANRTPAFRGDRPRIQLHLANTGSRQEHWRPVVDDLVAMSTRENPLLMVVGPGLSSANAEDAAGRLSKGGIPMISGVASANSLAHERISGLLRASPSNSDFTGVLRDLLDERADRASGFLVWDKTKDDLYVTDLRQSYQNNLGRYIRTDESFVGKSFEQVAPTAFSPVITQLCSVVPEVDTVFFAGRANDLEVFVETLRHRPCHEFGSLEILYAATGVPGDEHMLRYLEEGDLTLTVASATHPGWSDGTAEAPPGFGEFRDHYAELFSPDRTRLDDGYAVMHHDAVATAVHAVRLAADEEGVEGLVPRAVGNRLFHLHGVLAVQGASGTLEFTDARGGNPGGKYVPVIVLPEDGRNAEHVVTPTD